MRPGWRGKALAAVLGLATCVHTRPAVELRAEVEARCELVKAVLRQPEASRRLEHLAAESDGALVPVVVFVEGQQPGELERLLAPGAECGDGRFRVVRSNNRPGLLLLLRPQGQGYAYIAERVEAESLPPLRSLGPAGAWRPGT